MAAEQESIGRQIGQAFVGLLNIPGQVIGQAVKAGFLQGNVGFGTGSEPSVSIQQNRNLLYAVIIGAVVVVFAIVSQKKKR